MFVKVVNLYRLSGRPDVLNGYYKYSGVYSPELKAAIDDCEALDSSFGRFDDDPEIKGAEVSFCWILGSNDSGRFHNDIAKLINSSDSINNGTLPVNFYLIDKDFSSTDSAENKDVVTLTAICELVRLLSKIALGDLHGESSAARHFLFVLPASNAKAPKTIQLQTLVTPDVLKAPALNLDYLRQLAGDESKDFLYVNEHRNLFRVAIADMLSDTPAEQNKFTFLVMNWKKVVEQYQYNADCYTSHFSFQKARKEIAEMQLGFSTRLSSVLNDSASKLLALPITFAALIGIFRSTSLLEASFLALGTLLISLLLSGTIHNQLLQLKHVSDSYHIVANQFDMAVSNYPESLRKPLSDAIDGFHNQRSFLARILWFVRVLAWLPSIVGTAFVSYQYYQPFQIWIDRIFPAVTNYSLTLFGYAG